jgi:hypothetical protein
MNTTKGLIYISILVLILAFSQSAIAAGTYYYTDDAFEEKFGDTVMPPTRELARKYGRTQYVDSDAFYARFGSGPFVQTSVERYDIEPPQEGTEEEVDNETETQEPAEDIPVIEVPVAENATDNQTNETEESPIILPEAPDNETTNETNETEEPSKLEIISEESGELNESAEAVTKENGSEENETAAGAAVAGEDSKSLQITVIGFLIVIVVVMLVILLTKEEKVDKKKKSKKKPKKKDSWQEGDFLKKKKSKKTAKGKTPKAAKKPSAKSKKAAKKDKEVKPFLLKIKDEV